MKYGSLFSGIGGLDLALEAFGYEPAFQVEFDPHASKVLAQHWPDVPNYGDITKTDWANLSPVDVLVGGFPCQDISLAGKGAGITEGTRSGLWSHYATAISVLRPRHVFIENVAALVIRGLDVVLSDLARFGYDAEWQCVRASDVGAPHQRNRLFLVATDPDSVARPALQGRSTEMGESESFERVERLRGMAAPDASSERRWQDSRGASSDEGQDAGRPAKHDYVSSRPSQSGVQATSITDASSERLQAGRGRSGDEPQFSQSGSNGETIADATRTERRGPKQPALGTPTGSTSEPGECAGATGWGDYEPAIQRWEAAQGPAPRPADDRGRLNPLFVEWMMGFPRGWITSSGIPRSQQLKCLGNAVCPQQGAAAWALLSNA